jgi:DNA-binding transcriptional ArsR family regulator
MDIRDEIEDLALDFEACHKTLSAIGDETRQHIIPEMMRMDYNGSRGIDITAKTNLSRPAVSHHLQILKDAGIVRMRKEGTMTDYYLDPDMASFGHLIHTLRQSVELCARLPNRSGADR